MEVRFVCLGSKVVREIVARRSLGTRLFSVSHGGLLLQVERSARSTGSSLRRQMQRAARLQCDRDSHRNQRTIDSSSLSGPHKLCSPIH